MRQHLRCQTVFVYSSILALFAQDRMKGRKRHFGFVRHNWRQRKLHGIVITFTNDPSRLIPSINCTFFDVFSRKLLLRKWKDQIDMVRRAWPWLFGVFIVALGTNYLSLPASNFVTQFCPLRGPLKPLWCASSSKKESATPLRFSLQHRHLEYVNLYANFIEKRRYIELLGRLLRLQNDVRCLSMLLETFWRFSFSCYNRILNVLSRAL